VSGGDARLKNNYTITEIAGELRHETEKAYLLFHGNKEGVAGKVALRVERGEKAHADGRVACLAEWVDMDHCYHFHHQDGQPELPVLTRLSSLPPAPLDEYVSTVPMLVTRRHPYCMRAGREFPSARSPYIRIAVPAVITADPDVIPAWPHGAVLHDGMWRAGSYDYFISIGRAQ
jgi:hypothetical protein